MRTILAALLILFLASARGQDRKWHLFAGVQAVNRIDTYQGTRPSLYFLVLVPVKKWSFQYQTIADTKGELYHRVGIDFRLR